MARDRPTRTCPKRTLREACARDRRRGQRPNRTIATDAPDRVEVVAIFGPTASGKTAVAEALADALGTEVVSADAMQVYRGLPILTNQPERPTRLVGDPRARRGDVRRRVRALAHAAIDELVADARQRGRRRRHGPLPPRSARRPRRPPPAAPGDRGSGSREEVDRDGAAAHARLAELDPERRRRRAPERPPAARARARARRGRTTRCAGRATGCGARVDAPPDADRRARRAAATSSSAASASGRRRCSRAGVVEEVRARARADRSRAPPRRRSGSREIATLPPAEARERIVVRTRRYAAYQRKWMRRIPGLVVLDGTRPLPRPRRRRARAHTPVASARCGSRSGTRSATLPPRRAARRWRRSTAARVRRLCDVRTGIGSDGVLEVVARATDAARELRDLEPRRLDGRDVRATGPASPPRWLLRETGAADVEIVAAGGVVARARPRANGLVRQELGEVVVAADEELDIAGERLTIVPVAVGNPHAVVLRERAVARRPAPPRARDRDASAVPATGRTSSSRAPSRATSSPSSSGSAERGRRRRPGSSAVAVAAAAVARGLVRQPGPRRHARRRARRDDRAAATRRWTGRRSRSARETTLAADRA